MKKNQWCRHYRGFQHDTCDAGCVMENVPRFNSSDRLFSPPCIRPEFADKCPQHSLFTDEETAAQEKAIMDATLAAIRAKDAIVKHATNTGELLGTMPCPTCGKNMRYRLARSNNHAAAKCETEDCTSFIE